MAMSLWSLAVAILHSATPDIGLYHVGCKVHALLGSALGLLLVFRTNTAYNRFWEVVDLPLPPCCDMRTHGPTQSELRN